MNQQEEDYLVKKELVVFFQSFQQECRKLTDNTDRQLQQILKSQRKDLKEVVQKNVEDGLGEVVRRYYQQLDLSEQKLANKIRQLEQGLDEINLKNKQLVTRSWWVVSICLGVLVIGASYLLYHYKFEIEKNKSTANMTKIINQSDLTICGDRLCASVSSQKHGKYSVVNHR